MSLVESLSLLQTQNANKPGAQNDKSAENRSERAAEVQAAKADRTERNDSAPAAPPAAPATAAEKSAVVRFETVTPARAAEANLTRDFASDRVQLSDDILRKLALAAFEEARAVAALESITQTAETWTVQQSRLIDAPVDKTQEDEVPVAETAPVPVAERDAGSGDAKPAPRLNVTL